jgi:hypothetical protein
VIVDGCQQSAAYNAVVEGLKLGDPQQALRFLSLKAIPFERVGSRHQLESIGLAIFTARCSSKGLGYPDPEPMYEKWLDSF